jgi:RsiW-degrading membrane proteinase PrsW (M82 family)
VQTVCARLSEHAVNLAMAAGLLVIVGFVLAAGIAGYPALAADEDTRKNRSWCSPWRAWRCSMSSRRGLTWRPRQSPA